MKFICPCALLPIFVGLFAFSFTGHAATSSINSEGDRAEISVQALVADALANNPELKFYSAEIAAASIGIAMGGVGTDTAIETADITLMGDDLARVADAVLLGRRTLRIIQTNIAFALLVKLAFLVLAFTGHTSLWMAILADTGATLIVIANAMRLLRMPKGG